MLFFTRLDVSVSHQTACHRFSFIRLQVLEYQRCSAQCADYLQTLDDLPYRLGLGANTFLRKYDYVK